MKLYNFGDLFQKDPGDGGRDMWVCGYTSEKFCHSLFIVETGKEVHFTILSTFKFSKCSNVPKNYKEKIIQ